MAEGDSKRRTWLNWIAGDTRQTIISLIVSAIVLGGGSWLIGVASSKVPLWLVGLIALIAAATTLAAIVSYDRRLERLRGRLSGVEEGAEGRVEAAERNAQERIAKAEQEAESKVNAAESFSRVKESEAEERTRALSRQLEETRRQLEQATSGVVPLTHEAQAVLRSVRSLNNDLDRAESNGVVVSSIVQREAFEALVEDFQKTFGDSGLLVRAAGLAQTERDEDGYYPRVDISELRTMLGQLEAYANNEGQLT